MSDTRIHFLHFFTGSFSATVEMSCTSEYLFAAERDTPEPYLRYLPVMVTRLLLSLRKVTASREYVWDFGNPTMDAMDFAKHRGPMATNEDIRLDTFASTSEGALRESDMTV